MGTPFEGQTAGSAARRATAIGRRAMVGPTKVGALIDFGRLFNSGRAAYAWPSERSPSPVRHARRPRGGRAAAPAPLAARLDRRLHAVPASDRGRRLGAG